MHVLLLAVLFWHRPPKPIWIVQDESGITSPSCPVGYTAYASEKEAIAGRDFVHCVKWPAAAWRAKR